MWKLEAEVILYNFAIKWPQTYNRWIVIVRLKNYVDLYPDIWVELQMTTKSLFVVGQMCFDTSVSAAT